MCYNLSQYVVKGGPFSGVFIPALVHERQTNCGSFIQTHQWPEERRWISEPLHYLYRQTERHTQMDRLLVIKAVILLRIPSLTKKQRIPIYRRIIVIHLIFLSCLRNVMASCKCVVIYITTHIYCCFYIYF